MKLFLFIFLLFSNQAFAKRDTESKYQPITRYGISVDKAKKIHNTIKIKTVNSPMTTSLGLAIIAKESSFKANASTGTGVGLMQVNPKAHATANLFNIDINISKGVKIFNDCYLQAVKNILNTNNKMVLDQALACYNGGIKYSRKNKSPPRITLAGRRYIQRIKLAEKEFLNL